MLIFVFTVRNFVKLVNQVILPKKSATRGEKTSSKRPYLSNYRPSRNKQCLQAYLKDHPEFVLNFLGNPTDNCLKKSQPF